MNESEFNRWWFYEKGETIADGKWGHEITPEMIQAAPSYPNEENAYSEALWDYAYQQMVTNK